MKCIWFSILFVGCNNMDPASATYPWLPPPVYRHIDAGVQNSGHDAALDAKDAGELDQ